MQLEFVFAEIPPDGKRTWDDLVSPLEKRFIGPRPEDPLPEIGKIQVCTQCPFLKRKGEFFYFCEAKESKISPNLPRGLEVPADNSPEYLAHLKAHILTNYCFRAHNYQECEIFKQNI